MVSCYIFVAFYENANIENLHVCLVGKQEKAFQFKIGSEKNLKHLGRWVYVYIKSN